MPRHAKVWSMFGNFSAARNYSMLFGGFILLLPSCSSIPKESIVSEPDSSFSDTYESSRIKFKKFAAASEFILESHTVKAKGPNGETLSIDTAIRETNQKSKKTLVISSGLHGIEGFLGSAVQIQFLRRVQEVTVLERMRAENQNYWFGERHNLNHWTKQDLREAFFPSSPAWRQNSLAQSMTIIDEAVTWLCLQ